MTMRELRRVLRVVPAVNDDAGVFLLADSFSKIRFDWQIMSAISQSHE
jgi:hypothetical protein